METGLGGRVALVTGAGRGIGAAIARAFAREGCEVCLAEIDTEGPVRAVADAITARGSRALVVSCDVRRRADAEEAVRAAVEELGGLDVLVCNAGVTRDSVSWKMREDAWGEVLAVNLTGAFEVARAAIPVMRAAGWGRIVAVSSINGLRGKFGQANYSASKAGLIGMTKSLAREVGAFGITANVVAPGMVMTDMARSLPEDVLAEARGDAVLRRLAEPDEVADAVVFLCSDRARSVTGEVLRVDCGQYI